MAKSTDDKSKFAAFHCDVSFMSVTFLEELLLIYHIDYTMNYIIKSFPYKNKRKFAFRSGNFTRKFLAKCA